MTQSQCHHFCPIVGGDPGVLLKPGWLTRPLLALCPTPMAPLLGRSPCSPPKHSYPSFSMWLQQDPKQISHPWSHPEAVMSHGQQARPCHLPGTRCPVCSPTQFRSPSLLPGPLQGQQVLPIYCPHKVRGSNPSFISGG